MLNQKDFEHLFIIYIPKFLYLNFSKFDPPKTPILVFHLQKWQKKGVGFNILGFILEKILLEKNNFSP